MHFPRVLFTAPLLFLLACDDGPEGGSGGSSGAPEATSGSETGDAETGAAASTSGDDTTSGGEPGSSSGEDPSTTSGGETSTGEVPTSGPGVLPGETGQEAMCRRAFECGSTYYEDEAECVQTGTDYWGECAEVTAALDAFGACMADMACEDYNPDAYNPANTPCSELWGDLNDAGPC